MDKFKVIIVEDVKLELKGTEEIFRHDIPEAEIIGTAQNESEFWKLMRGEAPDLVLLDLGLGGSTTVGVDICRQLKARYSQVKVLVFTGEVLNEKLWVEVLNAGADGIILKTGNLLERDDVQLVMHGRKLVFNEPFLEKVIERFKRIVNGESATSDAMIDYEIDEYDERFLRHLALGYTKDMIGYDCQSSSDAVWYKESRKTSGRPHQPSFCSQRAYRCQCRTPCCQSYTIAYYRSRALGCRR